MYFISVIIATLPLWMLTLGPTFFHDPIVIPFVNIITSLALFVGALFVGVIIKYVRPKVAKIICNYHKGFSIIYVLYIFTLGTYVNLYAFGYLKEVSILVSGMLLPWIGTLVSGAIAAILRQSWKHIKTIAIETAIQNAAISLVLLHKCFDEPEADISSVMPIASFLFTPIPLLLAVAVKYYKEDRCCWQTPLTYDNTGETKNITKTLDMEMTEIGMFNPVSSDEKENRISIIPDISTKVAPLTSNLNFPSDCEAEHIYFTGDEVTMSSSFPVEPDL